MDPNHLQVGSWARRLPRQMNMWENEIKLNCDSISDASLFVRALNVMFWKEKPRDGNQIAKGRLLFAQNSVCAILSSSDITIKLESSMLLQ